MYSWCVSGGFFVHSCERAGEEGERTERKRDGWGLETTAKGVCASMVAERTGNRHNTGAEVESRMREQGKRSTLRAVRLNGDGAEGNRALRVSRSGLL